MPRLKHLALLLLLIPGAALADPPAGFAQRVESLRRSSGAPGVTVAIVENGRTTMAQGFGVTNLATPHPVNADTNFATGSTGKAFTAAALAILVDQGKLNWDDKGRLLTHSASTYQIPAVSDAPEEFYVTLLKDARQHNTVHGSKAVGEPPLMLAIAVREAIRDAIAAFGAPGGEVPLPSPATHEAIYLTIQKRLSNAARLAEAAE